MFIASLVPARTRLSLDSSSSFREVKTSSLPFILLTLTPATGPEKGISERLKAQEAANMLITAGSFSPSALMVVTIT